MAIDNVRFPTSISRCSHGGPERRTDVVTTASGREERNGRWANSKRRYNAGFGVKSLNDIQNVIAFFEERRGKLYAFRWKDFTDYKSCAAKSTPAATDQVIGTGDGATRSFQLSKKYGSGLRDYTRVITAPVSGTVLVAVNGAATTQFSVGFDVGIITLNVGSTPPLGAVVTAGFTFDVPVRFDTDAITINLTHFEAGEIPDIPLLEVRP
jgi:uncharacterized protein (TIGR02217 family)